MARHIVWDWNGTLLNDFPLVVRAASTACEEAGLPPMTADEYRRHFRIPVRAFYGAFVGRDVTDEEWASLGAGFARAYRAGVAAAPLNAGAVAALTRWRDAGGRQSLLSMHGHDELLRLVGGHGLGGWFERVDGLRGVPGGSKTEHLAAHLAALGVPAADVLVVGDIVDDAAAAAAAGAAAVLYAGDPADEPILAAAGVPVVRRLDAAVDHALAAGRTTG